MYILYGGAFTRALTVEMVLAEADLPYELREIDMVKGEHCSEEYRAICPTGMIPALITPEGETLYETP
ncbi:MAG: glutathione S-transferase N-terminal domain-containing protein, partial [Alphaproteobacteria bacterium]|nr:glutathione S-transferase N-terminal domain-containing protein [Alphaproteobacteria bacterium]